MTPLAYLILDASGRMVDSGGTADQSRFQARVDRWNDGPIDPRYLFRLEGRPYRLVPVTEIPAWQPIETARQFGKPIILGRIGCSTPGRWHGGMFRADNINIADDPPWTHWQPFPAPPKEKES